MPQILTTTGKIVEHVYVNGKHYVNVVDTRTGKPSTLLVDSKRLRKWLSS